MTRAVRAGLVAVTAITTLVVAQAALAANTGSIAVSYSPMTLGSADSVTIHVATPQTDDSIAQIQIFTGSGSVSLGTPGTQVGSVDAAAFAHDQGLNLPLSGPVTADDPAKHTTDACSPGSNQAVWIMNLSAAGQTLPIPIYVNQTSGAATALGTYDLKICLPPWDLPQGTPGRAFAGAQLLDAKLTLNKLIGPPGSAGLGKWEMITTPYTPGKGTPNLLGTFESRAFVPLPITLGIHASFKKKGSTWLLAGKTSEGGLPLATGTTLTIYRGSSPKALKAAGKATVKAGGAWSASGRLVGKKPVYLQIGTSMGERDYTATGCQSPAPASVAPAGCVHATLPPWSARSAIVRVKP